MSTFDIGTSPFLSSYNSSSFACLGITHLNSSSTPSGASLSGRIQEHHSQVRTMFEWGFTNSWILMRCQTTPRQAASRSPGNLVKRLYGCRLSPARKCRLKDDPSSCSPGKEILREVCSPPINLVPFLCRRSHAPLFMLPFFSSNWTNPAKHHQHLQGSISFPISSSRQGTDGWRQMPSVTRL